MASDRPPLCSAHREDALATLGVRPAASDAACAVERAALEAHRADCAACAAWWRDAVRVSGLLGTLDRLPAPHALEARLVEDLVLGAAGQAPLLRGLEPLRAPAELDRRVAADLAEAGPPTRLRALFAALPRHRAPHVLERLVAEELSDPAAGVTRRFVGDLFRRRAPRALDRRVASGLRGATGVRGFSGAALLLAAGLVAVVALPRILGGTDASVPGGTVLGASSRLHVVHVTSLEGLEAFAQGLAGGLAGVILEPMPGSSTAAPGGAQRPGGSDTEGLDG